MDSRDDAVEDRSEDTRVADAPASGGSNARSRDRDGTPDADADGRVDSVDPNGSTAPDDSAGPGLAEAFGDDRPDLGPLEPGTPSAENVFFVLLGAVATVLLFATAL